MEHLQRIIQESVDGKEVVLAHVIASPAPDIYDRIGVPHGQSIGILTLSPEETSIIAADIAAKAAPVSIGFLDRFTGAVVVLGDVQSVETSMREVVRVLHDDLGFRSHDVTRS